LALFCCGWEKGIELLRRDQGLIKELQGIDGNAVDA
jgi:hypothetical protein